MANLSITTAWNETAAFVKREARLLVPVSFMLIALPVGLIEILTPQPEPNQLPEPGLWLALLPVALLLSFVGNLAISYLALSPGASVREALDRGARRALPMAGAALLVLAGALVLLVLLLILVMVIVPGAAAAAAAGATNPAVQKASLIWLLLCLPFLFFFSARLGMMVPAAATASTNPVAIIARSWRLTAGHAAKLVAFVILVLVTLSVLSLAVESLVGSLLIVLLGPMQRGGVSAFLIVLVMAALNTLVAIYLASLVARIYAQLDDARPAARG